MTFAEYKLQEFGYKTITTFWDDFSIADHFGNSAVKGLFKRAFAEWKHDYKYLTELVIVLNYRCWMHYDNGNIALSQIYSDIYNKAANYAETHLKGEEYQYYFDITD